MTNSPTRQVKPITAGTRKMSFVTNHDLTAKKPHKALTTALKKSGGRDNRGHISIRHRGGGAKRRYRLIDFSLLKHHGSNATVRTIEYDPNRSARIALIELENGTKTYIIAAEAMKPGDRITVADKGAPEIGNRLPLKSIATGTAIYNIELTPGKGGQLVRSAGTLATILAKEGEYAQVRLPSGEVRRIHVSCFASIGTVSNAAHNTIRLAKAGRTRHMGRRPTVRGKAMNPVDHPHGGGEGNTSIGLIHPKTPTGKPALGHITRHNARTDQFIIKRRNKK